MKDTIVVLLVATVAFVLSLRWVYRTLAGKSAGCGCGENSCSEATSSDTIRDTHCCK
jgi:hypothetical protein